MADNSPPPISPANKDDIIEQSLSPLPSTATSSPISSNPPNPSTSSASASSNPSSDDLSIQGRAMKPQPFPSPSSPSPSSPSSSSTSQDPVSPSSALSPPSPSFTNAPLSPSLVVEGKSVDNNHQEPSTPELNNATPSQENNNKENNGQNGTHQNGLNGTLSLSNSQSGTPLSNSQNGTPSLSNSQNGTPSLNSSQSGSPSLSNSQSGTSLSNSESGSGSPLAGSGITAKKKSVDDFIFGTVIGEGSFGQVQLATDKVTNITYAAKILLKVQIVKQNKVKYVSSEKAILDQLRHPNIVRLFYTFQTKEHLYYILELCPKGELLHLIKEAGLFDESTARFYAAEILSAIDYIHEKGIAHRDIKPENVLLNPDMHAKLSDFGTAKELTRGARSQSFVGTAEYVCPELLSQRAAGQEADMWSYGVMVYQMLTGHLPFKGVSEFQVFQEITKNAFVLPDSLSSAAKDLISKLLVADPAERMTATQAKMHEFFATVDWAALENTTPPAVQKAKSAPITPKPHNAPKEPFPPLQTSSSPQPSSPRTSSPQSSTHPLASSGEGQSSSGEPPKQKSPKFLRRFRGEKRNSTPAISIPLNQAPQSSPSPTRGHHRHTSASNALPLRRPMQSSSSSPQLNLLSMSADGRIQGEPATREVPRARASSEFASPPLFPFSKPNDHSRWATFLAAHERILYSAVVQLRKTMIFSRHKLFLFITDKRLALLDPTTWKVHHEYAWGDVQMQVTLNPKDPKSLTLTTGTKSRLFEELAGDPKELVELVQYLNSKKK